MSKEFDELHAASNAVLEGINASKDFKQQLTRLIENAVDGNMIDSDVRRVISLLDVDEDLEA